MNFKNWNGNKSSYLNLLSNVISLISVVSTETTVDYSMILQQVIESHTFKDHIT